MEEDIKQIFSDKLDEIERFVLLAAKSVLTIRDASALTGFSVAYLYKLTSCREIPHYKCRGRVCFKKDELEQWMTEVRIKPIQDIEKDSANYINNHR